MAKFIRHTCRIPVLSLSFLLLQMAQVQAQPQITIQSGHGGMIRCLALSADEKYLASAGQDRTVIVWDVESERKVLAFPGHEHWIVALEFNRDSKSPLLASGGYDGTVRIWDVKSAKLEQEITDARPYSIPSLAFSPNGEMLAIATGTKISVWNIKARRMEKVLEGHRAAVTKIIYGNENNLFSSSLDGTLRMWNVKTGKTEGGTEPAKYGFAGMTVEPDKKLFAMAFITGTIKILGTPDKEVEIASSFPNPDFQKGVGFREYRLIRFVRTTLGSNAMVFLPDGKLAYDDGFKIRIWDPVNKVTKEIVDIESGIGSTSLVFSRKRNSIFYDDGTDVKTIELNSLKPHKLGNTFEANFGLISLDSRGVLLAGGTGGALIMTAEGRSTLAEYQAGSLAGLISEFPNEFTHAMPMIGRGLTAEISGTDVLLKKESNKTLNTHDEKIPDKIIGVLTGPGKIEKCWTDPENNFILCSTAGSKVVMWDVNVRKQVRTFEGNPTQARFSPDLTYLALAEEETLKIWNLKDQAARPTEINTSVDRVLVFSPNNRFLATRVLGGTKADIVNAAEGERSLDKLWAAAVETLDRRPRLLKIWDVKSGSHLQTLNMQTAHDIDYAAFSATKVTLDPIIHSLFGWVKGYDAPSGPISFSADGNLIAYDELDFLGAHSRIKVWNLSTKKEVCVFEGHTSSIRRIIFSPDDKLVLSSGWDNTLKIWNIASKELKATILTEQGGWLIFTPQGRFDTNLNLRKTVDVTWLWPQGSTRPLPLRVFLRDYYEPRLFRKILRDEPLKAVRDLTSLNVTQPKVVIRTVDLDGPDSVKVTVEVSDIQSDIQRDSQGRFFRSGVFDLRVFRNDQLVAQSTSETSINEFLRESRLLDSVPDRLERELELWRRTHRVPLDADGKATLTFEHIKLPKLADKKEVDFTAYAFNSDRVTSELSPTFKYRLAESPKVKARAYVVTIGVDANESGWNLAFATRSANEVQNLIAARLAKRYEVVKVSLLSTLEPDGFRPAQTQAKKENISAVLDILAGRSVSREKRREFDSLNALSAAGPDDLVFIYIASHGFSDRYGNFSMIPYNSGRFNRRLFQSTVSDCLAEKASGSVCDDSRKFIDNSISGTELATWLQPVDAGQIFMILDSCYSAAAPGSNFKPGPLGDRTFGQLAYDKRMTILTASQQLAHSPLKINSTLVSKTLAELAKKDPDASLLYLLQETEFRVPLNYQILFPTEARIQSPVLFDFSETENE